MITHIPALRKSFTTISFLLIFPFVFSHAYDDIKFIQTLEGPKGFRPGAVAASGGGRLFVIDKHTCQIDRFDPNGQLEFSWGQNDKNPAANLKDPEGLSVSREGRIYVADAGSGRILVYSRDGGFLFGFAEKGSGPGQLSHPESVFISHDDIVFVADTGNARIETFSKDGVFLSEFGQRGKLPGQFLAPALVAVDIRGNVWVADRDSKHLERFSPEGKWLSTFEPALPISNPSGIATDRFGYLYLTDGDANKIWEIGSDRQLTGTFGSKGEGLGQFNKLSGCALDKQGRLYLSDAKNHRVHVFELINHAKVKELPASPSATLYAETLLTLNIQADALSILPSGDIVTLDNEKGELDRFKPDGKPVWTSAAQKTHLLSDSHGMIASPDEKLYVSHTGRREVDLWAPDGQWQQSFGSERGEGRLGQPLGLGMNPEGKIFVADGKTKKVHVYNNQGLFLYTLSKTPALESPVSMGFDKSGQLYVLEQSAQRVSCFDPTGKYISAFGSKGQGQGQFEDPVSLAITLDGDIVVLDRALGRIQTFSPSGELKWSFGCPGPDRGQLKNPRFITFDKKGNLWVAEAGRIQEFRVQPVPQRVHDLKANSTDGSIQLSWSGESSDKEYRIYRSTSGEEPARALSSATGTKWIDSDLYPNLTYYYWISAISPDRLESPKLNSEPLVAKARANQPPLEIVDISVNPLFAAYYKFYAENPVGRVKIRNNTNKTYSKVKLGFTLKEFMDFPTETIIDNWPGTTDLEKPLVPVFNNRILGVTENTPIQAEVKLTYFEEGQEHTIILTKPVTMYERSALTWDNLNHLGAFITPKDTPVIEYARKALQPYGSQLNKSPFPQPIVIARVLFESLGANGLSYTPDPNNPNLSHKDTPTIVDYIQFPRQTLSRKTGDCDDLTPLYASLAEAVSTESGMADMPGHVMPLINTGETDPDVLGLSEDRFIRIDGELWIPVESTLVGKSFREAWAEGLATFRRWEKENKVKILKFHEAWSHFPPVTLPDARPELEPPKPAVLYSLFGPDWNALLEERLAYLVNRGKAALSKNPNDTDAMMDIARAYAEHHRFEDAEKWLTQVIHADPNNAAAFNNLGNTSFLAGHYPKAKNFYEKAEKLDPDDDGIELNLCRLALAQSQKALAKGHYERALALNPALTDLYPDLNALNIKGGTP